MQAPPKAPDKALNPAGPPGTAACVLGIDMGTTSVKAVLVEETAQGPVVVASCSKDTQAKVESPDAGPQGDEQDVHKIAAALNKCLADLPPRDLERVCRIGVSGQMHGVMFWKTGRGCKWTACESGLKFEPDEVSHLVTWQDGRCCGPFLSSLPQPQSHLSVTTGHACATIYWYLKNSPDFLKPYDAAGTIQDYVVTMLCGREWPRMSVQNAASWGYFNTTSKCWNTDILRKTHFPVHLLPEVVQSGDLAGETCSVWHRIPKGAEVGAALGDFQCSVYSSMREKTDAVLNIGTSAQLTLLMPSGFKPAQTPDPRSPVAYYPYFGDSYLAVAASLNGGNVMAAFVSTLLGWTAELGVQVSETDLYSQVIEAALAQTNSGLDICPTIFGERHSPEKLASVTGITASNLSLGHVARALCRGVVRNLHGMLSSERLEEAGAARILAGGSALCRNEVMRQEVERAFALPVSYGNEVDAARGAAMAMLDRT
ncbi:sedoheptulokinase [Varanus komodoensis]|uniref:Sedoheptulokinase n=1 Tax=Varanus komodoensis TaxID=61221 RepID=A0A8D2L8A2_VARKO|nr:sedoheptulokinase [Varanus komodoensis]